MDGRITRLRTFGKNNKNSLFVKLNFSLARPNRGGGECHVMLIVYFDDGLHIFRDARVYRGYLGKNFFRPPDLKLA